VQSRAPQQLAGNTLDGLLDGSAKDPPQIEKDRYEVYVLYWYGSTHTDARSAKDPPADRKGRVRSLLALLVREYKY
jgi:hypothetical protein